MAPLTLAQASVLNLHRGVMMMMMVPYRQQRANCWIFQFCLWLGSVRWLFRSPEGVAYTGCTTMGASLTVDLEPRERGS